ncbi:MAG: MFS transporter [Acidobacteriota bacterium]
MNHSQSAADRQLTRTRDASFKTFIPARMDRLPWSRFHWLVIVSLGITWVLDGLEVTIKGAISGVLQEPGTLHFTSAEIGMIASFYLTGAVLGSLFFGRLTDSYGRKKLFFVTLTVYLAGALLTAFSWNLWSFICFRFITGSGIGGEYSAINSAIDELIPARVRGWTDLVINGSYWIGAAIGSGATVILLDPNILPVDLGWRCGFGIGALLGSFILLLRKHVPESPRWLITHGYLEEGEAIVQQIEAWVQRETGEKLATPECGLTIHPRRNFSFRTVARTVFRSYPTRSILGLSLMISQACDRALLLPFAVGNFTGPLILGRFFDTVGRRQMIAGTYSASALLLLGTGWLFVHGMLTAYWQTALWTIIFFFASAAASSAYLTVSEIFPLETRALAIALFYSVGTAAGGIAAPWLFGVLIGSGSRLNVFYGYLVGSVLMLTAAGVEVWLGVKAERTSLEAIAAPLSVETEKD